MARRILPLALHIRAEQGIARGWSDGFIAEQLQVRPSDVVAVRLRMDAINQEPPAVPRESSLADMARGETARVYGDVVREWHGHAQRQPEGATQWERHRLTAATRKLKSGSQDRSEETA